MLQSIFTLDNLAAVIPQQNNVLDLVSFRAKRLATHRGIVVSPPIVIQDSESFHLEHSDLDQTELRYCLLFWDQIAWPTNNIIFIEGSPHLQPLIDADVLIRPQIHMNMSGGVGELYLRSQYQAFSDLEREAPGAWAMAQSASFMDKIQIDRPDTRELLVTLTHAVPIPSGDVPYHEILEFKARRLPELYQFRYEIESLYQTVINSADKNHSLLRAVERIENACTDLIRVNKEWQFGSLLGNLDLSLNPLDIDLVKGATAFLASYQAGLGTIASLFSGAVSSSISVKLKSGKDVAPRKANPYRYVASAHDQLKF